jgi:hypothetical protein
LGGRKKALDAGLTGIKGSEKIDSVRVAFAASPFQAATVPHAGWQLPVM